MNQPKIIQISVAGYDGDTDVYGLDDEGNLWYLSYSLPEGNRWTMAIPRDKERSE